LTQDKKWLKKLNDWHKIKKLLNKEVKRVIKIKWLTMIQLIQITYYVTCWCLWFRETQFKQHAVEVLLVGNYCRSSQAIELLEETKSTWRVTPKMACLHGFLHSALAVSSNLWEGVRVSCMTTPGSAHVTMWREERG
jgi:hypothetical protein